MSWFQRNRKRILVVGLFLFALLLLLSGIKDRRDRSWFDQLLLTISAPVQLALVWAVDGMGELWTDYVWLVGVEEENEQLRRQVALLRRESVTQKECRAENVRLRQLVEMVDKLPGRRLLAARVIGVGTSPLAQTIRLDAGSDDGIHMGDAVLSGSGLVGRVSVVVGSYAEVQLLIDARSAVDAVVQRSRARGIVRGQGEVGACLVDHLVRTADVEEGDLLVTSGIGSAYPAGLSIGAVSSVTAPPYGVFRQAELSPLVDFNALEEVLVVLHDANQPPPRSEPAP